MFVFQAGSLKGARGVGRGRCLAPSGQRPTEETAGRGGVWELGLDAPLLEKKWV